MKKKIISSLSLIAFLAVLALNTTLIQGNSTGNIALEDLFSTVVANAESSATVDCSDNISGPGSTTFRECDPANDCPKKKGSFGPKNGTCTFS